MIKWTLVYGVILLLCVFVPPVGFAAFVLLVGYGLIQYGQTKERNAQAFRDQNDRSRRERESAANRPRG